MKAIDSTLSFTLSSPWQGNTLPRLTVGLACSLMVHLCLGLWLGQPVPGMVAEPPMPSQKLEIRLVGKPQASVKPRPAPAAAQIEEAKPLAEPATPPAPEDSPAWLPEPSLAEDAYLAPEDVENMAYVVEVAELPLPENERTPGGALYLKVLISETGSADKIDVLTSTLPEDYALTLVGSFYQAKFSPALVAGLPVRSWRIIEVRFDLPEPAAG